MSTLKTFSIRQKKEHFETVVASAPRFRIGFQHRKAPYGDYNQESFEDTPVAGREAVQREVADKALVWQTEYAKSAYETLVAESHRSSGLYTALPSRPSAVRRPDCKVLPPPLTNHFVPEIQGPLAAGFFRVSGRARSILGARRLEIFRYAVREFIGRLGGSVINGSCLRSRNPQPWRILVVALPMLTGIVI